ncbi:SGNH/GDSL hydrolase family protein [Anabaena sp. UHCC 0451]|uniref:SGNH/GDSL hydrolase family protein n=1 Tax=Anabaena sp. UHCC 0451 TaxID=2055235 RepID=UPI002B209879|nr:SGNH/GDSL hydrolase family protein [Anabaena sp. UHCC 0451]MEA5579426.1 SGNH/GDSL hydrolase family protein [Anabaena sp. UHCC 0451]
MSTSAKPFPIWGFFLLVTNSILMLAIILLIWRQQKLTTVFATSTPSEAAKLNPQNQAFVPELGPRHKLSYQQWLDILKQEARVAAEKQPRNLTILAGDSLSLWFPPDLLPEDRNWLNQGISGETSDGLLKRLDVFDSTKPEIILVMIGINDLIRGVGDEEILANQKQIIRYLRRTHPDTKIMLQSILPHGAEQSTWEGRDKLLAIPNSRIRKLNQELQTIANQQSIQYLDLYPLFANKEGDMRREFSTDGLHLNPQGYTVWRTVLQIYSNKELASQFQQKQKRPSTDRI